MVLIVLLPVLITIFMQPEGTFLPEDAKEDVSEEELLCRLVMQQIPLESEPEAIKAQTVIARTMLLSGKENFEDISENVELKEQLGEKKYALAKNRIADYIEETKGTALTVGNGDYIDAAYHAVSAGTTRNAGEVYTEEDLDYLTAVSSRGDLLSPDYLQVTWYEKKEFVKKLQALTADETGITEENVMQQLRVAAYDSAGYVTEVQAGALRLSGEMFRKKLNLASACFFISECDGKIRVVTKGLGHGFGLSQYGANTLAAEGMGWREILKYYYPQVNISGENSPY